MGLWNRIRRGISNAGDFLWSSSPAGMTQDLLHYTGADKSMANWFEDWGGAVPFVGDAIQGKENYELQREIFNYQKDLQERIFAREDNTMQRRVSDLRAAGLSPVLASGMGAGTGQVVSTITPQKQKMSIDPLAIFSMIKMKADISRTVAEEALINAQRFKNDAETSLARSNTWLTNVRANADTWDLNFAKKYNTQTKPSGTIKTLTGGSGIIEKLIQDVKDSFGQQKSGKRDNNLDRSGKKRMNDLDEKILRKIDEMHQKYQK